MARRRVRSLVAMAGLAAWMALPSRVAASPIVLNFDALTEAIAVGTSYPGVAFTNATVLTAGSLLNDFEFPPYSGANVAVDDGGPMRIDFADPISTFSAYFTYTTPVSLQAFDLNNVLLRSTTSAFGSNLALSGDPGSGANELLSVVFSGISYVTLTGSPIGGSFVIDNAMYDTAAPSVPEPATLLLMGGGLGGLVLVLRRARRQGTRGTTR